MKNKILSLMVISFLLVLSACNNNSPFSKDNESSMSHKDDDYSPQSGGGGPDPRTNPGEECDQDPMDKVPDQISYRNFYEFTHEHRLDVQNQGQEVHVNELFTIKLALVTKEPGQAPSCQKIKGRDIEQNIIQDGQKTLVLDFNKVKVLDVPQQDLCQPLILAQSQLDNHPSSCISKEFLSEKLSDSDRLDGTKNSPKTNVSLFKERIHKIYSTQDCLCLEEWSAIHSLHVEHEGTQQVDNQHRHILKLFSDKCH